jgi:hypothetical protein
MSQSLPDISNCQGEFSTRSKSLWRLLLPALAPLALYGCDTAILGAAAASNTLSVSQADTSCRQVPVFVRPAPIKVDGILLNSYKDHDVNRGNFLLALNVLGQADYEYGRTNSVTMISYQLKRGFSYLEIEAPDGSNQRSMDEFVALGGDPHLKYLRIEPVAWGNAACSPGFRSSPTSNGMCVAAYPESEPKSTYALRVVDQPDDRSSKPEHSEPPALWQLVDLHTGQIYAQMVRHMAVYGGSCPKTEVRHQFWTLIQPQSTNGQTP